MTAVEVDARGLRCPLPVIRLADRFAAWFLPLSLALVTAATYTRLTRGAMLYHFPSREALVEAAVIGVPDERIVELYAEAEHEQLQAAAQRIAASYRDIDLIATGVPSGTRPSARS